MAESSARPCLANSIRLGYKAIEGATIFCKLRCNSYVETVHWLHQLLQNQDSDVHSHPETFPVDHRGCG